MSDNRVSTVLLAFPYVVNFRYVANFRFRTLMVIISVLECTEHGGSVLLDTKSFCKVTVIV